MRERPILFKTEMVKAILEGRKTMTRRIMKPQCDGFAKGYRAYKFKDVKIYDENFGVKTISNKYVDEIKCHYGNVGDVLWVKETYGIDDYFKHKPKTIIYKATQKIDSDYPIKWKSSLFMPKIAARIWLEITDIKVERLQDISEKDAINEGINTSKCNGWEHSPVQEFQDLWQSINGEESWEQNPFVWCVSFKVLSTTGKQTIHK